MKKIFALCLTIALFVSSLCADNFLTTRFFDLTVGADLGLSNNVTSVSNLLVKDLVIDLKKINEGVPDSGGNLSANVNPEIQLNLNLGPFKFALQTGIEMQGQFTISKDLFDFLGKGNSVGEEIEVGLDTDFDAFYFINAALGFKLARFRINFAPSVFLPLISANGRAATAKFLNDENGNVILGVTSNYDIYAPFDFENKEIMGLSADGIGFDLSGGIELPLNRKSTVKVSTRIPVIPGKIYTKTLFSSTIYYATSLDTIDDPEKVFEYSYKSGLDDSIEVYRPLKLNGHIDYALLGGLIKFDGGLGFGLRHPYAENAKFYPEYYFACTANLIDLLRMAISTEYTDQVFIHQVMLDFNVRFLELKTGVSLQSSSFEKSFSTSGFGAFVYLSLGF